ncbi:MAG: YihY/virulence factor BrkB family protein [Dehalococcoidia bacterium]
MPAIKERFTGAKAFVTHLVKRVGDADLPGLSAEMAYRFLFALFPAMLFLVALAGFFGTEEAALAVTDWIQQTMPEQAASILSGPVEEVMLSQRGDLLSIGAIAALWGASGVLGSLIKGLNRVHNVPDDRGFVWKNVLKVLLTLFLAAMVMVAIAAIVGTQVVIAGFGVLDLGPALSVLASVAGPLVALVVLVFAVTVVYWLAPAIKDHPFKFTSAGALLFAAGWVIGTSLLSWYIAAFGNYNQIYGSIGGIIVLLVWAYWSSFLLLLGGAFNAVREERQPEATAVAPATDAVAREPVEERRAA